LSAVCIVDAKIKMKTMTKAYATILKTTTDSCQVSA